MPERSRANRTVAKVLVAQVAATVALVVAVVVLGNQTRGSIRAGEEAARARQTAQLREECARTVARDFEAWGTNRDLAGLASDAAATRRASGDYGAARKYAARAKAAETRVQSIAARLPASRDVATVTVFCRRLYPEPTPDAG